MPFTINGIGTTYYGRKSARRYFGFCDSCQSDAALTDYETGHFFTVVFIPVIPLGKKQVVAECSNCMRHRAMPLKQWQTLKEETLEQGLASVANDMDDAGKTIELLYAMTMFNELDEANELAAACVKQHRQDFDVILCVGSWHEEQGNHEQAQACFSQAIELHPDNPKSKRIQAIRELDQGNPKAAAHHLEPVRDDADHYDPGIFLMLANGYQEVGMHSEALSEYQQLMERVPSFANDKSFRKHVKASEKAQNMPDSCLPKKGLLG